MNPKNTHDEAAEPTPQNPNPKTERKQPPQMPEPLNLLEMLQSDPAPLDTVLPGLLIATVAAMIASGGVGKSWLTLQLAILIAAGVDTLQIADEEWKNIKRGGVLLLPAEDPPAVLHHRLRAIGRHLSAEQRKAIAENLDIRPMIGIGADLGTPEWAKLIAAYAKEKRLIILDTARRYHHMDENDGGKMAELLHIMERICKESGAACLFTHHAGKAAVLSGKAGEQQASRGSSVLTDNARWQCNLAGISNEEAKKAGIPDEERKFFIRLGIPKKNYGPPSPEILLRKGEGGQLRAVVREKAACGGRGRIMPEKNNPRHVDGY